MKPAALEKLHALIEECPEVLSYTWKCEARAALAMVETLIDGREPEFLTRLLAAPPHETAGNAIHTQTSAEQSTVATATAEGVTARRDEHSSSSGRAAPQAPAPQRYHLRVEVQAGRAFIEEVEDGDGEWVKFSDVARAVAPLSGEARQEQTELDELRDLIQSSRRQLSNSS